MLIAHNMAAMNAMRMNGITNKRTGKVSEKLASGYRINRSADDAAGLAISEKMRRQIRGLTQASLNSQDGISLVQTADGAMEEISAMLQRCNELAVKAANGTNTSEDREYIQMEIAQITAEIERVTDTTAFNERPILQGDGDGSTITTAVPQGNSLPSWVAMDGPSAASGIMADTYTDNNGDTYVASSLDFSGLDASNVDSLNGAGFHFTCCTCDRYYSVQFDTTTTVSACEEPANNSYTYTVGIQGMTTAADVLSAVYNALGNGNPQSHYTQMEIVGNTAVFHDNRTNVTPDKSSGRGLFDQQTVIATKTAAANYAVTLQVGAEAGNQLKIELPNMTGVPSGTLDVTTAEKALQTIEVVKNDIQHVSKERSRMGAYQNRLEHTIANLDNVVENTQAAESRIRDTDMAAVMVEYSNLQILQQAGQAMMAQANQSTQGILKLLQ